MKLLIITQKADRADPILGFFHRWLLEFAAHTQTLTVIAQYRGECPLPRNVEVRSLGKEHGRFRFFQILTFWRQIWSLRDSYDRVLVHMTPIWVVLGAPLWLVLRKRVFLWYEARGGGLALTLALLLAEKVFSATAYGLPRSTRKSVVVGHGIDTDEFVASDQPRDPHLLCAIGRITRTKHLDVILRAFATLPSEYRLTIAGGTITAEDRGVEAALISLMKELHLEERVSRGFVRHPQVKSLLRRSVLMFHACGGGLDKVVLEAMACGCPVVTTSTAAEDILPSLCRASPETLGSQAAHVLALSPAERSVLVQDLRTRVVEHHSLSRLVARLAREMR
jgi:glycosyltransferase involved in cell wall biosynthesis